MSYRVDRVETWLKALAEAKILSRTEIQNARRLLFSTYAPPSADRILLTHDAEEIRRWLQEEFAEDIGARPPPASFRFTP